MTDRDRKRASNCQSRAPGSVGGYREVTHRSRLILSPYFRAHSIAFKKYLSTRKENSREEIYFHVGQGEGEKKEVY